MTALAGFLLAALYNVLPAELSDTGISMKNLLFYGILGCAMLMFLITGMCMPQFTLYNLLANFGHLMAMHATEAGAFYALVAAIFYIFAAAALARDCNNANDEPSPT